MSINRILILTGTSVANTRNTTLGILEKLSGHEVDIASIGTIENEAVDLLTRFPIRYIYQFRLDTANYYNPEAYANALHDFINQHRFDIVVAGLTSTAMDILPIVSTRFQSALATGVTDFFVDNDQLHATREIYGGKCLTDVEFLGPRPWFMMVRAGIFPSSFPTNHNQCEIRDVPVPDVNTNLEFCGARASSSPRPPLDSADIVVAGGRGLGDPMTLGLLEELADTLGAALGASGGAVGADYAPEEMLVGQTGTQISPLLYIACGISGAIQHLAGTRNAQHILAINTDSNAPLMRMADYAVIGDIRTVVPALIRQFSKHEK